MTIFRTGQYGIRADAIDACRELAQETTEYTRAHEPGTLMYMVLQEVEQPTQFLHLSAYQDKEALQRHVTGQPMLSNFQRVLFPALVGETTFVHYQAIASKLDAALVAEKAGQQWEDAGYIYRLGRYAIRPDALGVWQEALHETIADAKAHEPGTLMYLILQATPEEGKAEAAVRFIHLAIYRDAEAMERHVSSEGVTKKIKEVLQPALVGGVTFSLHRVVDAKVSHVLAS